MPKPPPLVPVADGVYRIGRAGVNCYLIVDDDIVLVDAGLPGSWEPLQAALGALGATTSDIDAIYLTHAHFDHVGLCDRLGREADVDVHVHPADRRLARHPYRYRHERARLLYPVRHPAALPTLLAMTLAGALEVKGVEARPDIRPGALLAGGLTAVATPGHTDGHCSFVRERDGVLFSGDALVTLDPYTGKRGPLVVARAATAASASALASLDALAATGARMLLPGHGDPFTDGAVAAVDHARRAGVD